MELSDTYVADLRREAASISTTKPAKWAKWIISILNVPYPSPMWIELETSGIWNNVIDAVRRYPNHPGVQRHGCRAMAHMAQDETAAARFAAAGACACALDTLRKHPRDEFVQHEGWEVVRKLANTMNRKFWEASDVAELLVKAFVYRSHLKVVEAACWALDELAFYCSPKLRKRFGTAGAWQLLIRAMQDHPGHEPIQHHACRAIGNLLIGDSAACNNAHFAAAAGAPHAAASAVLAALRAFPDSANVQACGCLAMGLLALSDDHRDAFAKRKVVVCELLTAALSNFAEATDVQRWACTALSNVATAAEPLRIALRRAGAVERVAEALRVYGCNSYPVHSTTTQQIATRRRKPHPVQTLNDSMTRNSRLRRRGRRGARSAAGALALDCPDNAAAFCSAGGCGVLMAALDRHPGLSSAGCAAIRALALEPSANAQLCAAGACEFAAAALAPRHRTGPGAAAAAAAADAAAAACGAAAALASSSDGRAALAALGACERVVAVLRAPAHAASEPLQAAGCLAVARLAAARGDDAAWLQRAGDAALRALRAGGGGAAVQENACLAVARVVRAASGSAALPGSAMLRAKLSADACDAALARLDASAAEDADAQRSAWAALARLAKSPSICASLGDRGVCETLVNALRKSEVAPLQEVRWRALARLARSPGNNARLAAAGAPALAYPALCANNVYEVTDAVLKALRHLSRGVGSAATLQLAARKGDDAYTLTMLRGHVERYGIAAVVEAEMAAQEAAAAAAAEGEAAAAAAAEAAELADAAGQLDAAAAEGVAAAAADTVLQLPRPALLDANCNFAQAEASRGAGALDDSAAAAAPAAPAPVGIAMKRKRAAAAAAAEAVAQEPESAPPEAVDSEYAPLPFGIGSTRKRAARAYAAEAVAQETGFDLRAARAYAAEQEVDFATSEAADWEYSQAPPLGIATERRRAARAYAAEQEPDFAASEAAEWEYLPAPPLSITTTRRRAARAYAADAVPQETGFDLPDWEYPPAPLDIGSGTKRKRVAEAEAVAQEPEFAPPALAAAGQADAAPQPDTNAVAAAAAPAADTVWRLRRSALLKFGSSGPFFDPFRHDLLDDGADYPAAPAAPAAAAAAEHSVGAGEVAEQPLGVNSIAAHFDPFRDDVALEDDADDAAAAAAAAAAESSVGAKRKRAAEAAEQRAAAAAAKRMRCGEEAQRGAAAAAAAALASPLLGLAFLADE
ncbi:hypothetical protein JKP88DRAFT_335694 [Tribonema minus]|uniref:Uncharacterized protein n=1 Tax=Tribonema minus TaxID=303371 RepID=A0A835YKK9_9STRA|nr:hypothetical protein JKP88DRAFT_335694 [Tribonema minus]